jgi:hypothetical protein
MHVYSDAGDCRHRFAIRQVYPVVSGGERVFQELAVVMVTLGKQLVTRTSHRVRQSPCTATSAELLVPELILHFGINQLKL